ncbi:MAG TPA: hypothetical protein VFT09_11670 [Ilumatobacteraceae bacterium]|nr:hypothetical protein [Ilumatobacteraceae bacterium]
MTVTATQPAFDAAADDTAGPLDGVLVSDLPVGNHLVPFTPNVPALVGGADETCPTDAAEWCLLRFAALEADVTHADLTGVGRTSAMRFPRLGGVLHRRIAPGTQAATLLTTGAERTIRAGYRAALSTHQVAGVPVEHRDVEDLWESFVPASYRVPRSVAATAWEVCRFDVFWAKLLNELGLRGDASRFSNGQASPLRRSIRGLSTVGVALALTERGGQLDRRTFRYQAGSTSRRMRPGAARTRDDRS